MRSTSKTGFTLIELLVVISILALLATILIPTISSILKDSRSLADMKNAKGILEAVHSYRSEHGGTYPMPGYMSLDAEHHPTIGDGMIVTAVIFHHLAFTMEMDPSNFNSAAASRPTVTTAAVSEAADAADALAWAGGIGTDYAMDWSARKSAGSLRAIMATRDPFALGTGYTNVVFADTHTGSIALADPDAILEADGSANNDGIDRVGSAPGTGYCNTKLSNDDIYASDNPGAIEAIDTDDSFARGPTKYAYIR